MSEPIAVLGAGSWGTSLAVHLARLGHSVRLWGRSPELVEQMLTVRANDRYLPGVSFPEGLEVTHDLGNFAGYRVVLVVVPSHGYREVLSKFLSLRADEGARSPLLVVSGTKGIETDHLTRMSQVTFEEALSKNLEAEFAVLSGPSFAAELAMGQPTAAVVAARAPGLANEVRDLFSGGNFRLYSSTDVAGVEIAGSAKNVVAIAAGVVDGLGFGSNTTAALLTRGLHEITRLGVACGGLPRTFSGLAGMGDLVLTCTGGLSRNRQTGQALAQGKTLEEIVAETSMVSEGVKNSRSLQAMAKERGVEMPIADQMVEVLYQGRSPRQAVEELMSRDLKSESEL